MGLGGIDALIDFAVEKVALQGTQGATQDDVDAFVHAFYSQHDYRSRDGRLLPPPSTDSRLCENVWKWLCAHADIRHKLAPSQAIIPGRRIVGRQARKLTSTSAAIASAAHSTTLDPTTPEPSELVDPNLQQVNAPSNASHNVAQEASDDKRPSHTEVRRVFIQTSRMWHSLTGHGPDPNRVPPMSFQLLSFIASHGEAGIIQPDLVKLSGQDKRSVPKRTDELAKAGYIEKRTVQTRGMRTSLCVLKKLVKVNDRNEGDGLLSLFKDQLIHTDKFLPILMPAIKKAAVITMNDLRRKLDIYRQRYESRVLHKYLARMENLGLIRRITARVETSEEVQMRAVLRSVQYLRDPTSEDQEIFLKFTHSVDNRKRPQPSAKEAPMASDEDDVDCSDEDKGEKQTEENDELAAMSREITMRRAGDAKQEPKPEHMAWQPDRTMYNVIHDVVERAGSDGMSTNGIIEAVGGTGYRRPVEMVLGHLTDAWQQSQPEHVRHLSLIRDVAQAGRASYYLYRTLSNFELAVHRGRAAWEAVMPTGTKAKKQSSHRWYKNLPVDEWGFLRIPSDMLHGGGGAATVAECSKATTRVNHPGVVFAKLNMPEQGADDFGFKSKGTPRRKISKRQAPPPSSSVDSPSRPRAKRARIMSPHDPQELSDVTMQDVSEVEGADIDAEMAYSHPQQQLQKQKIRDDRNEITRGISQQPRGRLPDRPVAIFREQIRRLAEREARRESKLSLVDQNQSRSGLNQQMPDLPVHESSSANSSAVIESRSQELELEYLHMHHSGVYYNPPQCILWKKGRQRDCALTVIKIPQLQSLGWFIESHSDDSLYLPSGSVDTKKRLKAKSSDGTPVQKRPIGRPQRTATAARSAHAPVRRSSDSLAMPKGSQELSTSHESGINETSQNTFGDSPKRAADEKVGIPTLQVVERGENGRSLASMTVEEPTKGRGTRIPDHGEQSVASLDSSEALIDAASPPQNRLTRHTEVAETRKDLFQPAITCPGHDARADSRGSFLEHQQSTLKSPTIRNTTASDRGEDPKTNCAVNGFSLRPPFGPVLTSYVSEENPSDDFHWARLTAPRNLQLGKSLQHHGVVSTRKQKRKRELLKDSIPSKRAKYRNNDNRDTSNTSENHIGSAPEASWQIKEGAFATPHSDHALRAAETNDSDAMVVDGPSELQGTETQERAKADDKAIASDTVEDIIENRVNRAKSRATQKKGTTIYGGGFNQLKREQIALEIIERNDGIYPDHKRSFVAAFGSEWRRFDGHTADEKTIINLIDNMKKKGIIRRLIGNYKNGGRTFTCALLCKPTVTGASKLFRDVVKEIEKAHPRAYIPPTTEIEEDLRPSEHNQFRRHDPFVPTIDVTVQRLAQPLRASSGQFQSSKRRRFPENTMRPSIEDGIEKKLQRAESKISSRHERIQEQKRKVAERTEKQKSNKQANIMRAYKKKTAPKQSEAFQILTPEDIETEYGVHRTRDSREGSPPPREIRKSDLSVDPTSWIVSGSRAAGKAHRVTFTSPEQFFHATSGTISTYCAITKSLRPKLHVDTAVQRGFEDRMETALNELRPEALPRESLENGAGDPSIFYGVHEIAEWERRHADQFAMDMTIGRPLFINHTAEDIGLQRRRSSFAEGTVVLGQRLRPSRRKQDSTVHTMLTPGTDADEASSEYEESAPARAARPKKKNKKKAANTTFRRTRKSESARKTRAPAPRFEGRLRGPNTTTLLSDDQFKDLCFAVIIARVLTGGFDKTIDWNVVDLLLEGQHQHQLDVLRHRWRYILLTHRDKVDRLERQFQDAFLEAYSDGTLPAMDFDNLDRYDWPSLLEWAKESISTRDLVPYDGSDLPDNRSELESLYDIQLGATIENQSGLFYGRFSAVMRQEAVADEISMACALSTSAKESKMPKLHEDRTADISVAKSLIRANVVAPESSYDPRQARSTIDQVPEPALKAGLNALLDAKTVKRPPKNRLTPGRNFKIHDDFRKPFRARPAVDEFMLQAYNFKSTLDTAFESEGQYFVNWMATEGEVAAMLNLVASGKVLIDVVLPPITTSEKLYQPDENGHMVRHLSIWGFTEGGYESSKVHRRMLDFSVVLLPAETYTPGALASLSALPPIPTPHLDAAGTWLGTAIPLWWDINGNFQQELWLQLMNMVLWDIVLQSGKTAVEVAAQFNGSVEGWEVEMLLEWLAGAGVARRVGDGGRGWTSCGEWWGVVGAFSARQEGEERWG